VLAETGRNWNAALAEFLASRSLYNTRAATRNAAFALRQLGRNAEAYELYTALLRDFGGGMSREQLASIDAEMRAVSQRIGEFELIEPQSGVTVVIDGRSRGITPLDAPIQLDAGAHVLRLTKQGYEPLEQAFDVTGGKRVRLEARLKKATLTGILHVLEANGRVIELIVDGTVVGRTPWRGRLGPGQHLVSLRGGGNVGTAPSSVDVRANHAAQLTLRAIELETQLRVEPVPANASVAVDGVTLGNGIWEGRLGKGPHLIEVTAPGHLPFRTRVVLAPGANETLAAMLDRNLSDPMWAHVFRGYFYASAEAGPLLAWDLAGDAAQRCDCDERSRPLGGLAALTLGYAITRELGVEVSGGYMFLSERMTRQLDIVSQSRRLYESEDYEDETKLSGPLAALGISYRTLKRTPFTVRGAFGVAWLTSDSSNDGSFRFDTGVDDASGRMSVAERQTRLLTPFVSTELRLGYRFSTRLVADLGLRLLLFLPPERLRGGANTFSSSTNRAGTIGSDVLSLPRETVAGPFLALAPTAGVRLDF
jgi:hypothetical protein